MSFTSEELQEIEDFAYKYLDKKDIALIFGFDAWLLDDEDCEAYTAFMKGRLKRKAQRNWNIMKLADQLSSPAQNMELKIAEEVYLNDKKR